MTMSIDALSPKGACIIGAIGTDEPKARFQLEEPTLGSMERNRHSSTGVHPFGWHRWSQMQI